MDPEEERRERRRKKILERAAREQAGSTDAPVQAPPKETVPVQEEPQSSPLIEKKGEKVEQKQEQPPKQSVFQRYAQQKKGQRLQVLLELLQSHYFLLSKLAGAIFGMLVTRETAASTITIVLIGFTLLLCFLFSRTKQTDNSGMKLGGKLDQIIQPLEQGMSLFDYLKLWLNVMAAFSLLVVMRLEANYI